MSDGVLLDDSGSIVAIVYGQSGVVPEGLTFQEVADVSKLAAGQSGLSLFHMTVQAALDASDVTMHRISEAVSLELTTWTAPDVVAWASYRRALRGLLGATEITALPAHPGYPAGI